MLQGAEFDSIAMWGVSPLLQNYYGLSQHPECELEWKDVELLYKDLDNNILPDLLGTGCDGHWAETFTFKNDEGDDHIDYHPKTTKYAEYLEKIGIQLTDSTKQWAKECDEYTASIVNPRRTKLLTQMVRNIMITNYYKFVEQCLSLVATFVKLLGK